MSQTAGFSYAAGASRYPRLPARTVIVGGQPVTCAQAADALAALEAASGTMVRQVLTAAGSPLAACDYHAAAGPYLARCLAAAACGHGRGAAGRPVTKMAFMAALRDALDGALAAEPARHFAADLARARAAFSADSGYAAAMAKAAVAVAAREHAAVLRTRVNSAVSRALSACGARSGQFTCAAVAACGTGDCRFAGPGLDSGSVPGMAVPAGAGRLPRPANHCSASPAGGSGFSPAAALAALEAAVPFAVSRYRVERIRGADRAGSADSPFPGSSAA